MRKEDNSEWMIKRAAQWKKIQLFYSFIYEQIQVAKFGSDKLKVVVNDMKT